MHHTNIVDLPISSKDESDWSTDDDEEQGLPLSSRSHQVSRSLMRDTAKRQKFNALRQTHYNMKQVLQHARELVENEEKDSDFNDPGSADDDGRGEDGDVRGQKEADIRDGPIREGMVENRRA